MGNRPIHTLPRATLALTKVSLLCVAVAILAEALSAVAYYAMTRSLPYLPSSRSAGTRAVPKPEAESFDWNNVLHPVLGFTRPPRIPVNRLVSSDALHRMVGSDSTPEWHSLKANNFGFFSPVDYPYAFQEDEEFIVAVVGGSVAHWFTLMEREYLEERIGLFEGSRGRRVRVLSFAQGAHKEPQQLLTLAYFFSIGQRIDAVLNIDGFNEVALSARNVDLGYDPTLPSIDILLPLAAGLNSPSISRPYVRTLKAAVDAQHSHEILTELRDRNRSAFCHFVLKIGLNISESRMAEHSRKIAELLAGDPPSSPLLLNRRQASTTREPLNSTVHVAADVWMRSSIGIQNLLACFPRTLYLHVLQPNQYFSRKVFTTEERQYAMNESSPYARYVKIGYPELRLRIPYLRSQGVLVADATEVFDSVPGTVYVDSCCHYNALGNRLLADFVLTGLEEVLDS